MAGTPKKVEAKKAFETLSSKQHPQIAQPNKDIDTLVSDIFEQAKNHRNLLIKFYVIFTAILSALVMILVFWQAAIRIWGEQPSLELIPQWALNLIITGMFTQFIGLLTIVTKRVWEFKPFLDHAKNNKSSK